MKINCAIDISISALAVSAITVFSSCQFSKKASQNLFEQASTKKFDMVVVPGVQFENDNWSRIMKGRIYWAKYLFDRGIAKNIMFSGSAVYSPYYEAKIMALYAEAIGIPARNVFTETRAEHSTENIYYSYQKSKQLGFKTMALASDPFQTKMLRRFIRRRVDKNIVLIPFVIDTMKVIEASMTDPKIPFETAYMPEFTSLKKRESFWQRLRGTMGKRLDKNAYK